MWASRSNATRNPGGISLSPLISQSGCYVLHPLLVLQPFWLSAFGLDFSVFHLRQHWQWQGRLSSWFTSPTPAYKDKTRAGEPVPTDQMVGEGVDHGGQAVSFSFSRLPLPRAHLSLPRIKHLSPPRKWRDEACDFGDGGECGLSPSLGGRGAMKLVRKVLWEGVI